MREKRIYFGHPWAAPKYLSAILRVFVRLTKYVCSFFPPSDSRTTAVSYAGAAVAQGANSVAEKLIQSYASIKKEASRLSKTKPPAPGGGGDGVDDAEGREGKDCDLALTLTTTDFNLAKIERIRLEGTRCVPHTTVLVIGCFRSYYVHLGESYSCYCSGARTARAFEAARLRKATDVGGLPFAGTLLVGLKLPRR